MQNLLDDLKELLKQDDRLIVGDELLKNKVIELALKLDVELISLLLSQPRLRQHFFAQVNGVQVFDKDKFIRFVSNKAFLPDSYTSFRNRIGLSDDGGATYLSRQRNVVLAWPYKDCMLEGGQTAEDAKRHEIFWNETLAPDDIDRLLDPKVLTNFRRIDADGQHPVNEIADTDNLIIKGNNLLALHFLKRRLAGEVKLIYIDPPFNSTGAGNTFMYNNTFNHSSWLTFMKNRVEVARDLLSNDGIFATAIDHSELFYLGVLLDEVFGRENRIGVIAVVHNPGGRQDDKFFPTAHENMLFYAKDIHVATLDTLGPSEEKLKEFVHEDEYGKYKRRHFRRSGNNSLREQRPGLFYPIYYNPKNGEISRTETSEHYEKILPIDRGGIERCWRWGPDTLLEKHEKYIEIEQRDSGYEVYAKERESDYQGEKAKTLWNKSRYTGQTGTHVLKTVLGAKKFSYPKSPYLIRDVIKITTGKNDLVLDFFLGSGTTAAVAHKMGRRYVGIEQMEYIEDVTIQRLRKVVAGEQGGISKDVDWGGGGSFVACQLMQRNASYIDQAQAAQTTEELHALWETLQAEAFLSYRVDSDEFDEHAQEFAELSLKDQKRFLLEVLDKNQLYVNLTEIEDADYQVSEEDKRLNRQFYNM